MTLTKQQVREVLDVYIRAWEDQDPDLICTIFTDRATYHERVMGEPIRGRDGIRSSWQTKVVGTQANITCELLNLYLDDGTAIAEWEATFDDTAQQVRKWSSCHRLPSPTSGAARTGDERHRALQVPPVQPGRGAPGRLRTDAEEHVGDAARIEQVSASGRTPMGAGPAPHLRAVRRPGAVTQDRAGSRRTPS
jgi:SnoaL-like domain